jgi:RNase P protein component
MNTLPKSERLCGKTTVSALLSKGRWGFVPGLKYCYLAEESSSAENRVIVSVPKRLFKRAVKRNLLKRYLREAYRTSKGIIPPSGTHLMLLYNSKEIACQQEIKARVEKILHTIADERQQ